MSFWRKLRTSASAAGEPASGTAGAAIDPQAATTLADEDVYADNSAYPATGALRPAPHFRPSVNSEDDRAYLTLLYQEHAMLARQQDWLRNLWALAFVVTIIILVVVGEDYEHKRICGALLCGTGVLGAVTLYKLRERYNLHLRAMRAYRTELGLSVRQEITSISLVTRVQHNRAYRLSRLVGTQLIWALVCLAAVTTGARLIWQSSTIRYVPQPTSFVPGQPAASAPAAGMPIQVPLGSELP